MLLHINPNLSPLTTAEDAVHRLSGRLREFGQRIPGYGWLRTGQLAEFERKFAETATPALIELTLAVSDLVSFSVPQASTSATRSAGAETT